MKILFTAIIALSSMTPPPAYADASFDRCVRKLCTSQRQQSCWVKAGAAMCDADQMGCVTLSDLTPAKAVRKQGRRWQVETAFGKGWVNDRLIMIDGSKCS
jgi:hypothetical protein